MNSSSPAKKPVRKPGTFETLIFGCSFADVPKLIPGVAMSALLVFLSILLTDMLNAILGFSGLISYILTVIVLGIGVRNTIGVPKTFIPGITFCLRKLLRFGIILMGIRLSIFDVLKIGVWGIPIIVVCVTAGLIITDYFARLLKVPERLAILIAVGTSICGASAIVATAPGIEAKEEEVSYAVANITIFGIVVLVLYPFLAHWLFSGDTAMAGLFTGTAIHETAQVAASGLIYDQTFKTAAGVTVADVAMVTKLVRNTLMAFVVPVMTFVYARRTGKAQDKKEKAYKKVLRLLPLFVLGFIIVAVFRSIGDAAIRDSGQFIGLWDKAGWANFIKLMNQWSTYILATAMAGVGLGTSFASMKGLGIKPFYVGLFAAMLVGAVSIIMVFLMGRFVTTV
jgi:uncharacterized integral membrane protein (TIGR00698 family)